MFGSGHFETLGIRNRQSTKWREYSFYQCEALIPLKMFRPSMRRLTSQFSMIVRGKCKKDFPNYKSLEQDDITRIKKSWVIIQENDHKFIDILNQEMICDIKMYEVYFKPLLKTEKCIEELKEFQNHPRNVYNMMDCMISDLENENVIIDKMVDIGERHGKIGVSRKHLNFMTSTIYQAVECTLGPCAFDRNVDQSWEKFLTSFNEVVGLTAVKECMKNK